MKSLRVLCAALVVLGCATTKPARPAPRPEPNAAPNAAPNAGPAPTPAPATILRPAPPTGEFPRREPAVRQPNPAAEAYRKLFVRYTLPSPNGLDYERSAAALASYLVLDPKALEDREVRRWQLVLSALKLSLIHI